MAARPGSVFGQNVFAGLVTCAVAGRRPASLPNALR
jgi:hypothetical protein